MEIIVNLRSWCAKPGLRLTVFILVLLPGLCTAQANPPAFSDVVSKATAARDANDAPAAIKLYRQALKLNSQWSDGWWFLGSLQYGAGEYSGARDALSHYLELTPNAAPALAMRGLCEFEIGDYEPSLKDIQRALALGAANQPRNEKIVRYHERVESRPTGALHQRGQGGVRLYEGEH
jgi:tetratricopeptide (TPR) repeat protein